MDARRARFAHATRAPLRILFARQPRAPAARTPRASVTISGTHLNTFACWNALVAARAFAVYAPSTLILLSLSCASCPTLFCLLYYLPACLPVPRTHPTTHALRQDRTELHMLLLKTAKRNALFLPLYRFYYMPAKRNNKTSKTPTTLLHAKQKQNKAAATKRQAALYCGIAMPRTHRFP